MPKTHNEPLIRRIRGLCIMCDKNPADSGVLSTGEKCAVGLILNNARHLPGNYSFLDAAARLVANDSPADDWFAACIELNRRGWRHE